MADNNLQNTDYNGLLYSIPAGTIQSDIKNRRIQTFKRWRGTGKGRGMNMVDRSIIIYDISTLPKKEDLLCNLSIYSLILAAQRSQNGDT